MADKNSVGRENGEQMLLDIFETCGNTIKHGCCNATESRVKQTICI